MSKAESDTENDRENPDDHDDQQEEQAGAEHSGRVSARNGGGPALTAQAVMR